MRVAVLGTGIMGPGMAHSLLRSGLDVTVWNRTRDRAAPLAARGADVAGSPSEAGAAAGAGVSVLWGGHSGADGVGDAVPGAPDGGLWGQGGTGSGDDARDKRAPPAA